MKKSLLIKKQSEDYKNGTTKSRCAKLSVKINQKDFDFILEHQRFFSLKIFNDLGFIELKRPSADHLFLEEVDALIKKYGYTKTFIKRQLIRPVLERYISYKKRFRKLPKHPIAIKPKNIAIYDGCVEMDKISKNIILRYHPKDNSQYISMPYGFCGTMGKKEKFISEKPGGQLVFSKNRTFFTVRANIPFKWQYQPQSFIGFDCNKSKETFLVFSKDIELFGQKLRVLKKTHSCLKRALSLEGQLAVLNKIKLDKIQLKKDKIQLKKDKIKKSKIRNKIKLKHKHHEKSYLILVYEILDYIEKNQLGIAIDALFVGGKTGSFGHDKLIKLLIREAENRCIPYVEVPTPYTTRVCSECGHLHDTIPLEVRKFVCVNCKIELSRDYNSARNIEKRGAEIWELGTEEVDKAFNLRYNKSIFKND